MECGRGEPESAVGKVLREPLLVCAGGPKWFVYARDTTRRRGCSVRQPRFMDRCKALINLWVLAIVFVRTLDSLETYFTARARQKKGGGRADRK
jgi:hypothetical protein